MNAQNATVLEQVRHLDQLGVPNTKIAKRFGVHRNTVANWLNGEHVPMTDLKTNSTPLGEGNECLMFGLTTKQQ